jgi:muramoyltetrapeptide carboxypeptidase
MINRRKFISYTAGMAMATGTLKANVLDYQDDIFIETKKNNFDLVPLILPKAIKAGDTIGITAPASPTGMWEIRNSLKFIKRIGCKYKIGKTVTNWKTSDRYLSASDGQRATEFMEFIENDDIDAILTARGGYGVMRILPMLDFDVIRKHPKPIIGFSDITALLHAVYQKSRIVSFHGPVAALSFNSLTERSFRKLLFTRKGEDIPIDYKPVKFQYTAATTVNPGIASGKLTGGNLSIISATLGTPYEIDTKDSILFIEEVYEEPYKIDRMLTQLHLAGKFDECNGIILGRFNNLDTNKPFYPGLQFSVRQIINQIIKPLNKPTVLNFPIGHGGNIITLPIGVYSEFDASKKQISILEQSVSY